MKTKIKQDFGIICRKNSFTKSGEHLLTGSSLDYLEGSATFDKDYGIHRITIDDKHRIEIHAWEDGETSDKRVSIKILAEKDYEMSIIPIGENKIEIILPSEDVEIKKDESTEL